jgi:hypothetical protein
MWLRLTGWIDGLPDWLQPPAIGALVLAMMACVRVVIFAPDFLSHPELALTAFGAIALSATGGALAGLSYTLVGSRLRNVPVLGPYLTGVFTIGVYGLAMITIIWFAFPDMPASDRELFDLRNHDSLLIWGGMTLVYGLIVGHFWFRQRA